jgi:thiamine pyrophosphate-dependent acetolactate synthase large subunit-like protein
VDRGIRIALAQRGVAVVILPKDVQDEPWEEPTKAHGFTRSGPGYTKPRIVPTAADLERAAEVLNEGRKVAILIGAWARGAAAEVLDVAGILGAGIAKAPRGKDVLPDDLTFVTGAIGLFGTQPSYELMSDCDTLLMIGTGFPWHEFLPPDGQARAVQIDIVQKYWQRWVDPRLIVCVLNNEDLNEVTWEQRASEGNPRYRSSQALPNVSYAKFAGMLGLKGLFVDDAAAHHRAAGQGVHVGLFQGRYRYRTCRDERRAAVAARSGAGKTLARLAPRGSRTLGC